MKRDYTLFVRQGTHDEIEQALRRELKRHTNRPSWFSVRFWIGFAVGAVLIASMDYGDIHLCVGACDAQSAFNKVRE